MPDGVVSWFDPASGDARVARGGHQYPARRSDMEPAARRAGARVHFDVHRDGAVETAVEVRLYDGTHSSRHHHGLGSLSGAHRPDTKGRAPVEHPHVEHGLALAGHPLAVGGAWGRWVAAGDLDHALKLYAPDAEVHHDGLTIAGRSPLLAFLEAIPVLGTAREPSVHGERDLVLVRWPSAGPDSPGLTVRCRVEHGQIAEQWFGAAQPESTATVEETPTGPMVFDVVTKDEVPAEVAEYARRRVLTVIDEVGDPVLYARVRLAIAPDPARARPALAQATLDVNGRLVRAHVASRDVHEAVDLLQRRLRDKLQHLAEHRKAERHRQQPPEPGEWRHGDRPAERPEYFPRPTDERELVRHKAFVADDLTAEEAAFDMDQADYDFYLYRDLATGSDSLLERSADGTLVRHHLHATGEAGAAAGVYPVIDDPTEAPRLSVAEAIERLRASGESFVFFTDAVTGRGAVAYRRYDGHDGLITLEG